MQEVRGSVVPAPEVLYRDHLARQNILRFRALGQSMLPTIRSGDTVHVAPLDRLREGDVLLYERGSRWFVHRLIHHRGAGERHGPLIFRGDGLPVADPPVTAAAVLGRVTRIERQSRMIRLDGPIGTIFRWAASIPILRYPIIPSVIRNLGCVKRCLISERLGMEHDSRSTTNKSNIAARS